MTGPDGGVPRGGIIPAGPGDEVPLPPSRDHVMPVPLPGEVPLPLEFETRGGDVPDDWKVREVPESGGA